MKAIQKTKNFHYIYESRRICYLSTNARSQSFKRATLIINGMHFSSENLGFDTCFILKTRILISTTSLVMQNGNRNTQFFSNLSNYEALQVKMAIHRISDSLCTKGMPHFIH